MGVPCANRVTGPFRRMNVQAQGRSSVCSEAMRTSTRASRPDEIYQEAELPTPWGRSSVVDDGHVTLVVALAGGRRQVRRAQRNLSKDYRQIAQRLRLVDRPPDGRRQD